MQRQCAVCDRDAPKSCSSCLAISYCSAEHQKEHWKIHKKNCSYLLVKDVPELGKGFVASRDIKVGTIILEEEPVAVAPFYKECTGATFCVTCGKTLSCDCGDCGDYKFDARMGCTTCDLPLCSLECAGDRFHANECQLFSSKGSFLPYLTSASSKCLEMFVMMIRVCSLREKDPTTYEQILRLQSDYTLVKTSSVFTLLDNFELEELLDNLKTHLGDLGLVFDLAELAKLHRIIRINYLVSNYEDFSCRPRKHLYVRASRFNHSCVPNCQWTIGKGPDYKIQVSSTTTVKKGEQLTICYDMRQLEVGTKERQKKFQEPREYQCKCIRCKDPTELGTFVSGLICKSCFDKEELGFLLPEEPLDLRGTGKWKCNRCSKINSGLSLSALHHKVGFWSWRISQLRADCNYTRDTRLFMKLFASEIISHQKVLHPNHWVIQDAERGLVDCISEVEMLFMTVNTFKCVVHAANHLLTIQSRLLPGLTASTATLQMKVALFLETLGRRLMAEGSFEEAISHLDESKKLLKGALEYWKTKHPKSIRKSAEADVSKRIDDVNALLNQGRITMAVHCLSVNFI